VSVNEARGIYREDGEPAVHEQAQSLGAGVLPHFGQRGRILIQRTHRKMRSIRFARYHGPFKMAVRSAENLAARYREPVVLIASPSFLADARDPRAR
jgi:hypothetical protein